MDTEKQELQPAFDFDAPESSFLLHKGQAEVKLKDEDEVIHKGDGKVRLDMLPYPRIRIYAQFKPDFDNTRIESFSFDKKEIVGFCINFPNPVNNIIEMGQVKWCPKSNSINGVGDESTKMTRVVFHLFNFLELFGNRESTAKSETTTHIIQHVDLACDNWNVELKSLTSTADNLKKLKAEGGYKLTHIGEIKKANDTSFSGKDAVEYLNALRFFFSFSKGCWCNPICAVGFESSNNRVWESWSSPRYAWDTPLSWFDPHHSSQLKSLFPGFMTRWADIKWHEALRDTLYWYLNANQSSRGIDIGIILSQTAIERLSYEYVVNDKRLLTAKGFKVLCASDKFRLLFSSLEIPLDIPDDCPELKKLASNNRRNWLDAPHALTEMRNSLVHPDHKPRGLSISEYFEAWKLSLWYLELSILAICGYLGTYHNRLKSFSNTPQGAGQVENVPWK